MQLCDDNIGEITGQNFDDIASNYNKGMPMRPKVETKREFGNVQTDFDIFKDQKITQKVHGSDIGISEYADIGESMIQMTSQLDPVQICSCGIDKINNNLFYSMFDSFKGNYLINGFSMYNMFSALYLLSSDNTEIELQKSFNFTKKDVLAKGIGIINNLSRDESLQSMINSKNFMIVSNDIPYNKKNVPYVLNFCMFLRVDTSNAKNEAYKINTQIDKLMNTHMKNHITEDNFNELQLVFLNVTHICPIWTKGFDKIVTGIFHGSHGKTKCNFLNSKGRQYGYYEDKDHTMIEISCGKNKLMMGFLLCKNPLEPDTDDIKLHFNISHLQLTYLDDIYIPAFEQNIKIRYTSTLQNLGIRASFMQTTVPQLFPKGVILQDVMQNIKITVSDKCIANYHNPPNSKQTHKTFIANKPFIYYFRLAKSNTILAIGRKYM
jgi:serine protease inhibitor